MNIAQALEHSINIFRKAQIDSAALDARILLCSVTGKSHEYILSRPREELSALECNNFLQLVARRVNLEPIAYITGYKEFYGRQFKVNSSVLIPRADTEVLISAILSLKLQNSKILELGTGSGCIAITLLLETLDSHVVATDISKEALLVANKNAAIYNIGDRLKLVSSNWFNNIKQGQFDIIVSNPPYIAKYEKNLVARETILYEPYLALFAENNGLDAYEYIAKQAKNFLAKDGWIILEIGFNQYEAVTQIFTWQNYTIAETYKDLAGYRRVIAFQYGKGR